MSERICDWLMYGTIYLAGIVTGLQVAEWALVATRTAS